MLSDKRLPAGAASLSSSLRPPPMAAADDELVIRMLRTRGSDLGATDTRFVSSRSVRSSLLPSAKPSRVTSSQDSPEDTLDSDGPSSARCIGLTAALPVCFQMFNDFGKPRRYLFGRENDDDSSIDDCALMCQHWRTPDSTPDSKQCDKLVLQQYQDKHSGLLQYRNGHTCGVVSRGGHKFEPIEGAGQGWAVEQ